DWHAHLIEPQGLGHLKLVVQIGTKLLADGGGGHGVNKRFALGDRGPPKTVGFENLLAGQQRARIASKPLDESATVGQVTEGVAEFGYHRAALSAARWRQSQDAVGPGDQAVHIHEPGLGPYGRGRQARQERVLELARNPPTGRYKALEGRMVLVGSLEHAGGGMGDIVQARTAQAVFLQ